MTWCSRIYSRWNDLPGGFREFLAAGMGGCIGGRSLEKITNRIFGAVPVKRKQAGLFNAGDGGDWRGVGLLRDQAHSHGPGDCRQNDEGQPDVAEKSDVGDFVLDGWRGVHDGLSGPALSYDQRITALCLYGT